MRLQNAVYNSVVSAAQRAISGARPIPGVTSSYPAGSPAMTPRPMPPVTDNSNFASELQPQDLDFKAETPGQNDNDILTTACYPAWEAARKAQVAHHPEWFNSWTMYAGEQWRAWNKSQNRYLDTKPGPNEAGYDPTRRFRSYNHIEPLVGKTLAKATSTKPNANLSPWTSRPTDIGATKEARGVVSHCDNIHDGQEQIAEACEWAAAVAPACIKIYWDNTQPALIPQFSPSGEVTEIAEVPNGGEIVREIVSPFEWFPDPKAKSFKKCQYLIHAQVVPLSYVQERFKKGWSVKPDAMTSDVSGIEARMAQITGDTSRNNGGSKLDGVLLIEKWEKRTARYKKGRLITWANGVLLRYDEQWPDGDGTSFPFVPVYYKKSLGSAFGRNAVTPLIDGQILINKTMSRREEWCDSSAWVAIFQQGSESGPDAMKTIRDKVFTKLYVKPGFQPLLMPTPPMNADMMNLDASAQNFMRDNIGVHEVSDGRAPAGVDTAAGLQLLQQSDDTQLAPFIANIARAQCDIAEIEIEIARTKYIEPRLLMVSDTSAAKPDDARTEVFMFQHLSEGRVVVSPGTATTENPVIRTQKILDMNKAGMFQPQALPATIVLLKLLGIENSDKLTDDLQVALQQMLEQQPNPADIAKQQQEAQAQAAQAVQQAQQQHEAELQAAKDHNVQLKEQMKTDHDAQLAAINHTADERMKQIEQSHAVQMAQLNGLIESHLKKIPAVSISGKMGGVGVASAESADGLESDPVHSLNAIAVPAKSQPGQGAPINTRGRVRR